MLPHFHAKNAPVLSAQVLGFQPGPDDPVLFRDITLHLNEGEVLAVCGINGSGKSTLLQVLAGLLPPSQGTLVVHGALADSGGKENGKSIRTRSALLLQDADMQILGATVGEDILIGCQPGACLVEKAKSAADALGLLEKWDEPPAKLSYGQKRKLCLASALLRSPSLLLLDEPLSGLDYPAVKELLFQIDALCQKGTAVVITTHDLDIFYPLTDKYLFLSPHQPALYGQASELFRHAETYGIRPFSKTLPE